MTTESDDPFGVGKVVVLVRGHPWYIMESGWERTTKHGRCIEGSLVRAVQPIDQQFPAGPEWGILEKCYRPSRLFVLRIEMFASEYDALAWLNTQFRRTDNPSSGGTLTV